MRKFKLFPCRALEARGIKVVIMTFTMVVFTMAFAQAQEYSQSKKGEKRQQFSSQFMDSHTIQRIDRNSLDFTANRKSISLGNTDALNGPTLANRDYQPMATVSCDQQPELTANSGYPNFHQYIYADNLEVDANVNFHLDTFEILFLLLPGANVNNIFLTFYEDNNGNGPGVEIPVSLDIDNISAGIVVANFGLGKDLWYVEVALATPIEFSGGATGATYWAGARITNNGEASPVGTNSIGTSQTFYVNPGSSWIKSTDGFSTPPQDLWYSFYGQCEEVILNECTTANAGTIVNDQMAVCPNAEFTVAVTGATEGFDGLVGQWQVNIVDPNDEGSWISLNGITASSATLLYPGVGDGFDESYFRYVLTCTVSNISDVSNVLHITMNMGVECNYCVPILNCTDGDVITNVSFGDINNTTTCSPNGYGDYTHLSTTVMAGVLNYMSVTVGDGYDYESVSVWIDFNNNGDFEEEEFFFLGTGSGSTVSNMILIPEDVANGDYRMRVRVAAASGALATWDLSCDEGQAWGETEDYTISVVGRRYTYQGGVWSPHDPSGIATAQDEIHVYDGIASLTADTDIKRILIVYDATLEIHNVLNLYDWIGIDGELIFVSNENGNGELGFVAENASINGDVTVQRYMSENRAYRMVSSPVNSYFKNIKETWQEGATCNTDNPNHGYGIHITGTRNDQDNGFDGTITGNPSMFTVNHETQEFVSIPNTFGYLEVGDTHLLFVRGDRGIDLSNNQSSGVATIRSKGSLHLGEHTQTFPAPNHQPTESNGFVMIGNPYQSSVDMNSVLTSSNTINMNTNHYYMYDPTLGTHGAYVTVDLPSGANISDSAANQYLQPGQAVQVALTAVASSSITFSESDKAPGMGSFTTTNATSNRLFSDNMLTVQLYTAENFTNGGPTHDSFGIIFSDNFENAITAEDAIKPMNFYENLGIDHDGTYLSIERRAMPESEEVYSLYSAGYSYVDYTLKINIDGLADTFFYLDDSFTGTSTLLEGGETVYSFSVDANDEFSISTDRFSIRTEARLGVENTDMLSGIRLFPNPLNNTTFYIHAPKLNGEQVEVNIADMTGRQIFNNRLDCQDNRIAVSLNDSLTIGVYLVTVKFAGEENTYRLVKQ